MAAEYKARVAERLRKAREAKGLSQSALARQLPGSVDGPSVSRWERAIVAPKPDTLEALADVLDVDVSYFLVAEPEEGTPDLMGALAPDEPDALERQAQLDRIEAMLARVLDILEGRATDDAAGDAAERLVSGARADLGLASGGPAEPDSGEQSGETAAARRAGSRGTRPT